MAFRTLHASTRHAMRLSASLPRNNSGPSAIAAWGFRPDQSGARWEESEANGIETVPAIASNIGPRLGGMKPAGLGEAGAADFSP